MQTWRRFRTLSAGDRALIVEAATLLALVRIALPVCSFSVLRSMLRSVPRSRPGVEQAAQSTVCRIAWAVPAAAAHLPLMTTCLVQALAGETMLRRRGYACELRFGVQPPAPDSVLNAHSWIEHDGTVIIGDVGNLADYRILSNSPSIR